MDDYEGDLEELEGLLYSQIHHLEKENVQLFVMQDPKATVEDGNISLNRTPFHRYHTAQQTDFSMPPPTEPSPFQINRLNSRKRMMRFSDAFDGPFFPNNVNKKSKKEERKNKRRGKKKKVDNLYALRSRNKTPAHTFFNAGHTNKVELSSHVILISDDENSQSCQNSTENSVPKVKLTRESSVGDIHINEDLKEPANIDEKQIKDACIKSNKTGKNIENDNDDVIFIEIPKVIITIDDEESQLSPNKSSKNVSNIPSSKSDALEELELLSIPESNSNDFLESLNSSRFGLGPEDLDVSTTTQNRSTYLNDNTSSISSISEMEIPSSNFLFNSLKCNSPTRELNLNDFANFIQCKNYEDLSKAEIVAREKLKMSNIKKPKQNISNGSNTSSESDYCATTSAQNCNVGNDSVIIINEEQKSEEKQDNESTNTQFQFKFVEDEYSDYDAEEYTNVNDSSIELVNVTFPEDLPKDDDYKSPPQELRNSFSDYWSEDMQKFYRESWGQENFSIEQQRKTMSNNPKHWRINSTDRNGYVSPKSVRCNLCRQHGHKFMSCPQRFVAPKCVLCGTTGHFSTRCPNQFCATCNCQTPYLTDYCNKCKKKSRRMQCKICSFRGHTFENCTDLWRRYIFTTAEGPLKLPIAVKLEKDMWCSYCAQKGHYNFNCNYKGLQHPPTSSLIYETKNIYRSVRRLLNEESIVETNNASVLKNTPKRKKLSKKLSDNPNLEHISGRNSLNLYKNAGNQLLLLKEKQILMLLGVNGSAFLQNISLETHLNFKLIRQTCARTVSYYCAIAGKTTIIPDVKLTIRNFCNLLHMIPRQMKRVNHIPQTWEYRSTLLYKRIKVAEQKLPFVVVDREAKRIKNSLTKWYSRLNTALMAKYRMGKSEEHITFLKHWQTKLHSEWQYVEEAVKAYDYVFNNPTKFDFHYQRLIQAVNKIQGNGSLEIPKSGKNA